MKNKKAQTNIIEAFFMFLLFFIIWFVWLGSWVSQVSRMVLDTGNVVGVEAFFYANLNVIIWFVLIIAIMSWSALRSE